MRRIPLLALLVSTALLRTFLPTALVADEPHAILAIGAAAPNFSLAGVDGKVHTLDEYSRANVLVIIFTCNHCPTAQLYESRIKALVAKYQDKNVAFVAIEPNSVKSLQISELGYTDVSDSLDEMKVRAAYRHFNFPYLYDGETQSVTLAYGPQATPHVFVFDHERKLRYEGHIDNNQRESLATKHEARDAIEDLLSGKPVAVEHTRVFGCSTKWLAKEEGRMDELRKFEAEPVTVSEVSADGLKKLRENSTGKFLLVNFWATWCGPCVQEMPELQTTWRMYRQRDFDMVTVSANMPDEKPGVLARLQKLHASSKNLVFGSTDTDGMQAAFDQEWKAGVPYTILIAPNGSVIYREQGAVDVLKLRRIILANLPDPDYIGHRAYWASERP
jgi:peroxiredoxin